MDKVNKATIGGESIDIKDNILLLGNLQQEYQIKLYDIKAGKLMTGDWLDYSKKKSMIVSATFLYLYFNPEPNKHLSLAVS